MPPTLLLSRPYLVGHVPAGAYTAAVEAAFQAWADGEIEMAPVGHQQAATGAFHVKAAMRSTAPRHAVFKINANFPDNPVRFGLPTIQGLVVLFDADSGSVLALLDSGEITARRTAAASAVAARRLARADCSCIGFVGCGVQARYHLEALAELFRLTDLRCFDVDRARASGLVDSAAAQGFDARALGSAGEVARAADLLVTCTPSRTPLIRLADVPAGTFIAAVGADSPHKQELDVSLLARARLVVDVLAQAATMGDLHHAIEAGALGPEQIHGELADVVAGRVAGRTDPQEVFVFDSTGVAIEDLAAATLAYGLAAVDPAAPVLALAD